MMFIPLFQQIEKNNDTENKTSEIITSVFEFLHLEINYLNVLLIIILIFLIKAVIYYIYQLYFAAIRKKFNIKLRRELISKFNSINYLKFITSDVGNIQNTFTNDVSASTTAYSNYFLTVQSVLFIMVYLAVAFYINFQFTLFICLGAALSNLIFRYLYKTTKKISHNLLDNNVSFFSLIIQYINNFKYLKATHSLPVFTEKIYKEIDKKENNLILSAKNSALISALREPILVVIICLTIFLQVYILDGSVSAILVILLLFFRALNYVLNSQTSYNAFLTNIASLDNIARLNNETALNSEKNISKGKSIIDFENIRFNNLVFKYDNSVNVLNNINIEIQKNKTIAFVGESGSGKTTLINILSGLILPERGQLSINGTDINDINLSEYRSQIGYITQEPVIFNDSILNNITFWNKSIDNERLKLVLEKAHIKDFINGLPEKENTQLGHNGVNISGGQKQRISIARELYKNVSLLILDEATSALDTESEQKIKENIDELKGSVTTVVIAHRLSTIKSVDYIYLLDKGEIIASGDFNELLENSDKFRTMVNLQKLT